MSIRTVIGQLRHLPSLTAILTYYLLLFDTASGAFTGRWGAMLLPVIMLYFAANIGIGVVAAAVYLLKYLVSALSFSDEFFIYVMGGMYVFGAIALLASGFMNLLPANLSFVYWLLVIPAFLIVHGLVAFKIWDRARMS